MIITLNDFYSNEAARSLPPPCSQSNCFSQDVTSQTIAVQQIIERKPDEKGSKGKKEKVLDFQSLSLTLPKTLDPHFSAPVPGLLCRWALQSQEY